MAKMNDDKKQSQSITLKILLQTKGKKQSDKNRIKSTQKQHHRKETKNKKEATDENIRQGFENLVKFIESLK